MSSSKCSAILNHLKHSIVVQKYSREVQTNSQNLNGEVALLRSSFSRSSLNYYGAVRPPSSQEQFAGSLKYYVVLQISHHFAGTTLDRFLIGTLFSVKHST